MTSKFNGYVYCACILGCAWLHDSAAQSAAPTPGLSVTYGPSGIQRVDYAGVTLEDMARFNGDRFSIGHMKVTDTAGQELHKPEDGWGDNSSAKKWDPATHTWTYGFGWGTIRTQYQQAGDTLNIIVTETNRPGSGVVLAGASIFPLALHFPDVPQGFGAANVPQVSSNDDAPGAVLAAYGKGEVAAVVTNPSRPLFSGFWPAGGASPAYRVMLSSTTPDGIATFIPRQDRLVKPGQTDTFTLSLRFAGTGTPLTQLAADAYRNWSAAFPSKLHWTDHRIIGTSFLAKSPNTTDVHHPSGFPNNPRRYFENSDPASFDIGTAAGLSAFQAQVLRRATDIVANLRRMHGQGVITWDIEGEEYAQDTSYVCAPDTIANTAPEMESVVTVPRSPFAGMKLDDAYFKIITSAGMRAGVCVRPQHFVRNADGTAGQSALPNAQAEAELLRKMRYAHDRWKVTLFYIDSNVDANGWPLPASMFARLAAAFPDSLLIPEHSKPAYYAYTAPFQTFLFHGDTSTGAIERAMYPDAFSCNLINDVDGAKLSGSSQALTAAVRHGDILLVHAGYWHPNNATVASFYAAAGRGKGE